MKIEDLLLTLVEDAVSAGGVKYAEEAEKLIREELEMAWMQGFKAGIAVVDSVYREDVAQRAADYAERVVGGRTRPEKP